MKAEALEFSQAGYDAQIIDTARLSELAPHVQLGDFHVATFNSMDGHIDPVATTRRIIEVAARTGVEAVYPCTVEGLRFENQRLVGVATSKGHYDVDRLVVAGGVDSPVLLAEAGYTLPMIHAPGILMHSGQTEAVLQRVVESPNTYFKQYRDGRIVGNDGYYAPNIPEHAAILAGPTEMPREIQEMHGKRIFEAIKTKLPPAAKASYSHLTLGYRPMPGDRMPTVGPVPGNPDVYVAVMHSGVTLAPIMSQYIARELMYGDTISELAPYRPDRFA
jgi:glycine/D-amino acid oxidase-like deaminating enzyme